MLDNETIGIVVNAARTVNWDTIIDGSVFTFKHPSAERGYCIEVSAENVEELIDKVYDEYESFDSLEEICLRLSVDDCKECSAEVIERLCNEMTVYRKMILSLYNSLANEFVSLSLASGIV